MKISGIPVDVSKPSMHELGKADWEPHIGKWHYIPCPMVFAGGSVSFSRHLGKPLTQWLWEDLVYRLGVRSLKITPYDGGTKGVPQQGDCDIFLDESGKVSDIQFMPYSRYVFEN